MAMETQSERVKKNYNGVDDGDAGNGENGDHDDGHVDADDGNSNFVGWPLQQN